MHDAETNWSAGAAEVDITPERSVFLYGYPHVPRMSTGVHDSLLASALCLGDGQSHALFIACDLIFVPRPLVVRARERIAEAIGIDPPFVMITATHTHSGPVTLSMLSNEADELVPPPDAEYLQRVEDAIVRVGCDAYDRQSDALVTRCHIDASFLGTNRRDPAGPSIPRVSCLWVHDAGDQPIAAMPVVSMHPTVLHEDSTLVSGDFPGLARQRLKQRLGDQVAFVYHMGSSGDQSPRYVVKSNTLDEASRLGHRIADELIDAIAGSQALGPVSIRAVSRELELPLRELPSVEAAEARANAAKARLAMLREQSADRTAIRTAEVDWFGAEETLTLSRAAGDGRLPTAAAQCMPAEVQAVAVGEQRYVAWPGEVFVEFALLVNRNEPEITVVTLANGDLQGYVVTQQAIDEGAYEAGNAIFASPTSGELLVATTQKVLAELT